MDKMMASRSSLDGQMRLHEETTGGHQQQQHHHHRLPLSLSGSGSTPTTWQSASLNDSENHSSMSMHPLTSARTIIAPASSGSSLSFSSSLPTASFGHTTRVTQSTSVPTSSIGGRDIDAPRFDLIDEQIRAIDPSCLEVGPEEHPLQHGYSMWFSRRTGSKQAGTIPKFEETLKLLATFRSVEKFWKCYTHLRFPSELTGHADYHLFKYGIKPMWEDPANREGGKWVVRLCKGVASRVWENVLLAILGEQFLVGDEICGAVMSVRYNQEDIISIWNRTAEDMGARTKIIDTLRRVTNLPISHRVEYKLHNRSLLLDSTSSTFRSTDETFFR